MSIIPSRPYSLLFRHSLRTQAHSRAHHSTSLLVRPTTCSSSTSSTALTPRPKPAHKLTTPSHLARYPARSTSSTTSPACLRRRFSTSAHVASDTDATTTSSAVGAQGNHVVEAPDYLSESEREIFEKLKLELQPIKLEVQDISGGCGSMYGLDIISPRFSGLSVIKQHKLVNGILQEELKKWHGVQLKTKAP